MSTAKTLYIIGNGFDLHHGLRTSYYDFARHLKANDSELYSLLDSYISFPQSDKDLWGRFEENLANLDTETILSDNSNYLPNISSEEFRSRDMHAFPDTMEGIFKNLTENLIDAFTKFIREVIFPESANERAIHLDGSAHFLSFNYTVTLEKIYNVQPQNILYIHNCAFSHYRTIILGHGTDPEKFKEIKPEPPANLSEEEVERWLEENDDWDYSYDTGKENLMRYFPHSYKPTKQIISQNKEFFSSLNNIENISVLGHSISPVDVPYFEEIVRSTGKYTHWTVSYYNGKEKETHLTKLQALGIAKERISFVELSELQKANNQLKLAL